MNVLVHAVGSPLGQSILKSLKISDLSINIFVSDIYDDAAGLFMVPEENRIILPPVKSPLYHDTLIDFVKSKGITSIFPVISPEHDYYELHHKYYAAKKVSVVKMNKGVYEMVNNKLECFNYLNNLNVIAPKTFLADLSEEFYNNVKTLEAPFLLKPIRGASGKDIFRLDTIAKIESIISVYPPNYFLIQEYLGAKEEYTVGVYRSAFSDFEDTFVINRDLQFGLSYKGEIIDHQEIADYALAVCRALGTTYSANVQLKLQNGQPMVFEVNPRLSSTTYIRAHFGFNEPEMILKDILSNGQNLSFNKRKGKFSRYWGEFFFEQQAL